MNDELTNVEARALVHAALADPGRLAIVDILGAGDASPGELGATLSMATNLVAHHLNVLQDAGLLARVRSEGDQRRTYVRLIPEALARIGSPAVPVAPRVVFVCTHNSARSQLAAALWAKHSTIPTASAGTQPADRVHPRAVRVARRHGLNLDPRATAHVNDVLCQGDLVIAVCDTTHERLPVQAKPRLHWSVPDPARTETDEAFEDAYRDIATRVERLAPAMSTGDHRD